MPVNRIIKAAIDNFEAARPGAYYGSATGLALGAGLIFRGVPLPSYNAEEKEFDIIDSLALVLSHECDVANERAFNDHVLVCPIIPLDVFAATAVAQHTEDHAFNLVKDIAKNVVARVFFLPPPPTALGNLGGLSTGGLLYLNRITAAHVDLFARPFGDVLCAFSSYAQQRLDQKLTHHLLRPKSDRLPQLT